MELQAPEGNGEVITDIQVRFVDRDGMPVEGYTRPYIITREFDLQPGDSYDPQQALAGLERVVDLSIVRSATLTLEPTADPSQAAMVVNVEEASRFGLVLGYTTDYPSVTQGPTLRRTVEGWPTRFSGFFVGPWSLQQRNIGGNDQSAAFAFLAGDEILSFDLSYEVPGLTNAPDRTSLRVNAFTMNNVSPHFTGGEREVSTANGDDSPWVQRTGGGMQLTRPLSADFKGTVGLAYQQVSVNDDLFGDRVREDEFGNTLTLSDSGNDDLLTLNLAGVLDRRDDTVDPTRGYWLRLGLDQAIPVGDADIFHTRLSANYSHFLQVPLFGFAEGPRTLLLNLQGGTVIGDLPPYEAYVLGGSYSVRGYESGEISSARSFVQASAEYRYPIANFKFPIGKIPTRLGGSFFVDYADDLGTGDNVIGSPAEARDKPGSGLGVWPRSECNNTFRPNTIGMGF